MRERTPFPRLRLPFHRLMSHPSPVFGSSAVSCASRSRAPRFGSRGRRPFGFTLVELLVVIAIIALIITMLLPALSKARDAGNRIVCASNLRSMGQALHMYIADYKAYPGHAGASQNGRVIAVWPARLRKYTKTGRRIFYCPAQEPGFQWQHVTGAAGGRFATQSDADKWGYEVGELLLDVHTVPFSYGYNDWGAYNTSSWFGIPQKGLGADLFDSLNRSPELKATLVRKPSEMIAIADNTCDGSWDYAIDPTNPTEYPGRIHNKGANVLFCDGHVDWFLQADLAIPPGLSREKTQRIQRMWNNDNKPN